MNRLVIPSDPGGGRILEYLYPIKNSNINNWESLNFEKIKFQNYDEICIGTSVEMLIEKKILMIAPTNTVIIVLDEVYNVKGRLNLLGKHLLSKVKQIIYIKGTPNEEILPRIQHSFIQHPSLLDKKDSCKYLYDKSAPLLLIDEYKDSFNFIEIKGKFESDFLSNCALRSPGLVYRSHPARNNKTISNYEGDKISGAIGYTTNYLIETLKKDIPTFTCSKPSVNCILNKNSKRNSEIIDLHGLKFVKINLDIK